MGHMVSDERAPGLRERKKLRTRDTIRTEALKLFEANGYSATTVEQIADAADVSPSTFFRYFTNKEALLIPDQLMDPIIDTFINAPPELSPVAAYRLAVGHMFTGITSTEWEPERARQRLMYSLPEARGALYAQYITTIEQIRDALAIRLDLPADDPRLRTTAGAITGVIMASLHAAPMDPDDIYRALDFLNEGLPFPKPADG